VDLLHTEVLILRKVNKRINKQRKTKKTHIQLKKSLTIQNTRDQLNGKAIGKQLAQEEHQNLSSTGGSCTKI